MLEDYVVGVASDHEHVVFGRHLQKSDFMVIEAVDDFSHHLIAVLAHPLNIDLRVPAR